MTQVEMIDTYITEDFAERFKELIILAFPTAKRKPERLIIDTGITKLWSNTLRQVCEEFDCIELYNCGKNVEIARYCRFTDDVSKQIVKNLKNNKN